MLVLVSGVFLVKLTNNLTHAQTVDTSRDTHIMPFKVPIMLRSDSQHQANYAHHFVPIMLAFAD